MQLPPEGLCCRVQWVRNRGCEVVEVQLRTGQVVAVRLLGYQPPEEGTCAVQTARLLLDSLLERNDEQLRLWLPPLRARGRDGVLDALEIIRGDTAAAIPGRLFIGTEDVAELLIRHGLGERI